MNTKRQARLAELVWNRRAAEIRKMLIPKLVEFKEYEFLDMNQSAKMGDRFWSLVKGLKYLDPNNLEKTLKDLSRLNPNQQMLWFHRYTNEAGLIVVSLDALVSKIMRLRNELGPDILIAEYRFTFGISFEDGENESYLRQWGISAS